MAWPCFFATRKNKKRCNHYSYNAFRGTAEGIRTPDLLVRSQTLYPAELQPHTVRHWVIPRDSLIILTHSDRKSKNFFQFFSIFCEFAFRYTSSIPSSSMGQKEPMVRVPPCEHLFAKIFKVSSDWTPTA